ncbi:MAG TPA: divalent metal cation transporter [Caulobacteraceae bacterium]|jgi:NRAMP (natural resistance-associated macrophage protein)-like metal ion transporter|nr:divalent metal cation transporter [Caulobacteraceae bacterium]
MTKARPRDSAVSTPVEWPIPNPHSEVKRGRRPKLRDILGPGLITGASDDDPSGIATYSQAGAQFGYDLGWTLFLSWPLMCAIQEICGRIGRVTGRGIAGNLRRHYPRWLVWTIILLLATANTINLGADMGAMGAALGLVIGGSTLLYTAGFGLLSVVLEVFVRYARYVPILKWLTLSLFAYVGVVLVVGVPWGAVLRHLVIPKISLAPGYLTVVVAVLGTTISPYLFFWQAENEVEDMKERDGSRALKKAPDQAPAELSRIRWDTWIGMGLSNTVALSIVITTAATLHAHGITNIETSSQAALALKPIAGPFVFVVFAMGIIGTGLLALPVLAGSAAYALGEVMAWRVGLARKWRRAPAFYGAIVAAMVIGGAINFTRLDPMKALFWSAVINGVTAVPLMALIVHLGQQRAAMGEFTLPPVLRAVGWLATAAMAAAAVGMFMTFSPNG